MPKPPHPVDASWLRVLDAVDALVTLTAVVRAAGSALTRPGQERARERAAEAMAGLGLDRYEHLGVRLVLVPARCSPDGEGGYVVVGRSYVRVSLDPAARRTLRLRQAMKVQGGATIVDLLERRAARERVA